MLKDMQHSKTVFSAVNGKKLKKSHYRPGGAQRVPGG